MAESNLSGSFKVGTFNTTGQIQVAVHEPPNRNQSSDSLLATRKRSKRWKVLEIVCLTIVVLVIIVLTSLPVVFFYLPRSVETLSDDRTENATSVNMCDDATPYTGRICRDELLAMAECFPDELFLSDDDPILVVQNTRSALRQTRELFRAFELFGSAECVAAATPFLCLHLFGGVCDKSGGHYLPTAGECLELSTGPCRMEWELARSFGMEIVDCDALPRDSPSQCFNSTIEEDTETSDVEEVAEDIKDLLTPQNCTLSCRDKFFCDATVQRCFPSCSEWNLFPERKSIALDHGVLLLGSIGFVAGVVILVISCLRRSKVYVFPSVIVVYQTISLLVLIATHLLPFSDRSFLHCTSRNLLDTILTASNFCVITGMLLQYLILQINLWWVMHVLALFWKVLFPVHARSVQSSKRLRVVHVVCVLIGVLVPVIPVVATIVENAIQERRSSQPIPGTLGFGLSVFPPIFCSGLDENVSFYTLILPNVLLIIFGTVTMVLTIWRVHRIQGLFRSNQLTSKNSFYVSTAEKKLVVVFCYYIVLQVVGFVTYSLTEQSSENLQTELFSYFLCEQSGHDPSNPCSRSGFEAFTFPEVTILSVFMALFSPFVNFVFVVDYHELKEKVKGTFCSKK